MVYLLARAGRDLSPPFTLLYHYFVSTFCLKIVVKVLNVISIFSPRRKRKNLNSGPPSWINHHRGRCYTIVVVVVAVVVFIVVVVVVVAVVVILLSLSLLPSLLSLPTSSLLPSLLSLPTSSSSLLLLPSWRKNPKLTPTAAVENFGEEYQNFGHIQGVKIRKNDYLFIR